MLLVLDLKRVEFRRILLADMVCGFDLLDESLQALVPFIQCALRKGL